MLFVGEGSTLAHAARCLALAAALPRTRYEAILALPERYRQWVPPHVAWVNLQTQDPAVFAQRLTEARPLFSTQTLKDYFEIDMALLGETRPDVVVGDLRLSLAVSAREAKVPYLTISNAYWSSDLPLRVERPALTALRWMPRPMAEAAFRVLLPGALKGHVRPLAKLAASRGMEMKLDVRRVVTEADVVLYADIPGLFPGVVETPRQRFLGPVLWAPPTQLPAWWEDVPEERPIAYLTLGSSGDARLLERLCAWLEALEFTVMVATAGRADLKPGPARFVADYLPGAQACARADVVICNGGSPTATQALMAGKPVLGVCGNMDQFMNMRAIRARGAGLVIRADRPRRSRFERGVDRLLMPRFGRAAEALRREGQAANPAAVLADAIDGLMPG